MLGHRSWYQSICFDLRIKTLLGRSVGWIVTIGAILSKPRLVMDIHLRINLVTLKLDVFAIFLKD